MAKLTKKQKAFEGKVDSNKLYAIVDALSLVKECATAKFDESIDVAVQLGVDAKKSDQVVVAPSCCRTVPAKPPEWRYSRKARKLKRRKPLALTSLVWMTSLPT